MESGPRNANAVTAAADKSDSKVLLSASSTPVYSPAMQRTPQPLLDTEKLKTSSSPPQPGAASLLWRVAFLGIAFSLLFTGYNVAQSFVTTLFPGAFGYIALGVIYFAYAGTPFTYCFSR